MAQARLSGLTWAPGREDGHALADGDGHVGHRADDWLPAGAVDSRSSRLTPAATEMRSLSGAELGGDLGDDVLDVLGLHRRG